MNSVNRFYQVGVIRLERTTPCTPCKCASQLRHTPNNKGGANLEKAFDFSNTRSDPAD